MKKNVAALKRPKCAIVKEAGFFRPEAIGVLKKRKTEQLRTNMRHARAEAAGVRDGVFSVLRAA